MRCSGVQEVSSVQGATLVWQQQNAYSWRTQPQGTQQIIWWFSFYNAGKIKPSHWKCVSSSSSYQVPAMQKQTARLNRLVSIKHFLWLFSYLASCVSGVDCCSSLDGAAISGRDIWRRQGSGWRWGVVRALWDRCAPPAVGRLQMDGGTLEKRDSCSLISSSISTWTSAAPRWRWGGQ